MDVELPFEKLVLTSFGYQKFVSRPVPQDRLTHIGLTIIADKDTPFRLEIAEVRAVARTRQPDANEAPEQLAKVAAREERVKLSIARRKRAEREAAAAADAAAGAGQQEPGMAEKGDAEDQEEEEEEEQEHEEEKQAQAVNTQPQQQKAKSKTAQERGGKQRKYM